jgi:cysteinyl-tRNA synthetase
MAIELYNTLTRQREPLIPRDDKKISMYVCGPTPYNYPHIGNARAAVAFDVVYRYLDFCGYNVMYVTNFTDIEDKIINRAAEQGIPWDMLAEKFIGVFFEEMDSLNVKRASIYPRATENIPEIVSLVTALVERGHAYAVDGDVYFAVRSFETYGALSGRKLEDMEAGARVEISEIKRDPLDFALWKGAKPGEPSWESPWGPGRPGWHIECSAMAMKYLGAGFDIHGGGQDLVFPHHENEIAQSQGAMDGDAMFARYWLHNGFVTINKEKMSKSLGNFFTVREVLEKYPAPVVRYFLTAAHYRSPLDFSDQALDMAQSAYERLRGGAAAMERVITGGAMGPEVEAARLDALSIAARDADTDFRIAMNDDFNTPEAVAVLFNLVGEANKLTGDPTFRPDQATLVLLSDARATVVRLAAVLGIQLAPPPVTDDLADKLMALFIDLRTQARKDKNFPLSDAIRDRLMALDLVLEDTPQGTVWRRK